MISFNRKNCLAITVLPAILVMALTGCAGNRMAVKHYEEDRILHFSELQEWDETKSLNNYVVYLDKGDTFPLVLTMDTDFIDFKQDRIDIVAKKKIYFRVEMPENLTAEDLSELSQVNAERVSQWSAAEKRAFFKKYMLHVSTDALHWAPLSSVKALREALGYSEGIISCALMAAPTHGLEASFMMKTLK
jgi:hypothetical protein